MKIIHCADLHLDSALTAHLDREKSEQRKAELTDTFARMTEYAYENQVSAIIIAGDLFDTARVSAHASHAFIDIVYNHPEITFFYLRGNHDEMNFVQSLDEIPENLKCFRDDAWTYYTLEEDGKKIVFAGLEGNDPFTIGSLDLAEDAVNFVIMHGTLSEYDSKRDIHIRIDELMNKNADVLALGHLHTFKHGVIDERGEWYYPGCLEGRGFDEAGRKGFILYDTKGWRVHAEFVPFASRTCHLLEADVTGCTTSADMIRVIADILQEAECAREDLVRVTMTGEIAADAEKNRYQIRTAFESQYWYFELRDATVPYINYEDYIYDRSLKGEFVRMVKQDMTLSAEDQAKVIRCGLLALNEEADL